MKSSCYPCSMNLFKLFLCAIILALAFNQIQLFLVYNSASAIINHVSMLWFEEPKTPFLNASLTATRSEILPGSRRTRAHFCQETWCWKNRSCRSIGQRLLEDEFGFQSVDATKENTSWDLIFGGYLYCGIRAQDDVFMRNGLNRQLNEQGWENLKPNQVWFPCMGCRESYCSKLELCKFLRSKDKDSCFVLPEDEERWKRALNGDHVFVLKGTGVRTHDTHAGRSIHYVQTTEQVNRVLNSTVGHKYRFIAQRYNEPFLGVGDFGRMTECQVVLAITSTSPLRLYMYEDIPCRLSPYLYTNVTDAVNTPCMSTTVGHIVKNCYRISLSMEKARIFFSNYTEAVGWSTSEKTRWIDKVKSLLTNIFQAATPAFVSHKVNEGIQMSGASCFSYMRADFGVSRDKSPFLFEINEIPDKVLFGLNPSLATFRICEDSLRDLFHMIGLDQPPMPVSDRADYEANHSGGWVRLL